MEDQERSWSPWSWIGTPKRARGTLGAYKIGNQVAAYIANWSMVPGDAPGSWVFTAHAFDVNRFLMTQGPDLLVLQFYKKQYRWRPVRLELGGDQVLRGIVVGRPKEKVWG